MARERPTDSESRPANTTIAMQANATPPSADRLLSPTMMIIIGGVLLLLATGLTVLFVQQFRRPARASFISQSFERR